MSRRSKAPKSRVPDVPPPRGLRAMRFALRGREIVVLSYPSDPVRIPDTLSVAEKDVTHALLHGATNADIARQRGVSERTVANQIASIFRKLEVSSRSELAAKLRSARSSRPPKPARGRRKKAPPRG